MTARVSRRETPKSPSIILPDDVPVRYAHRLRGKPRSLRSPVVRARRSQNQQPATPPGGPPHEKTRQHLRQRVQIVAIATARNAGDCRGLDASPSPAGIRAW